MFFSPFTGLAGLLEHGTAELVIDVAREGRTTETVMGGLSPVPPTCKWRKVVKKYKGRPSSTGG